MVKSPRSNRKTIALIGLLALQAFSAVFFLADAMFDMFGYPHFEIDQAHQFFELLVTFALIAGTVFTALAIRGLLRREAQVEQQLRAASGAFLEIVSAQFDEWALTPAERDVAMLTLKGLSIAEVADIRETREGTVKAQLNAIYGKAGLTGRGQLTSHFIEELLGEGLQPSPEPNQATG